MARDSWVRRILLGRRDGVRAWLRQQTGVLAWLDETDEAAGELRDEPTEGPGTPAPSPTPGAGAASGRDGWVRVLDASEVGPGQLAEVFVKGRALVVANVEGSLHAVDSVCPHAGGPLADGELEGSTLTCPWHGWSYDVTTGDSLVNDAVCLHRFPVRLEQGGIFVEV